MPPGGWVSLARLAGAWRLTREVRHATGQVDRMAGMCRFTPIEAGHQMAGLLQKETGVLETAQGRFQASRQYIWTEADGAVQVYFDDMRPFLSIPKDAAKPHLTHICDPDRYDVVFDFTHWPNWQAVWRVTGPRKSYVMTSHFAPDHP